MNSKHLNRRRAVQLLLAARACPEAFRYVVALMRVRRGIAWLNVHAPRGWHRNLFDPAGEGASIYRGNQLLNDFSVLGIAFEAVPEYAGLRYVSQLVVADRMSLTRRDLTQLGFDTGLRIGILRPTYQDLNRAWESSLRVWGFSILG